MFKYIIILAILIFSKPNLCQDSLIYIESFGKFQSAASISTAREEFIFVSDIETNKIYKFSESGKEKGNFGGTGLGINELNQPYSVDASNGLDVLIADYQNNRLTRLDINLNFISSFDFNIYNQTADNQNKIYNPKGIVTISTGEIFILADASNYHIAKINEFADVKLLFGSNSFGYDKLNAPVKITKGNQLDMWVLDKATNEILNFNNFGSYIRKITPAEIAPKDVSAIITVSYYNDYLYILANSFLAVYDLKKYQFTGIYYYSIAGKIKDIALLNKSTVLLLSEKQIHKYKLIH